VWSHSARGRFSRCHYPKIELNDSHSRCGSTASRTRSDLLRKLFVEQIRRLLEQQRQGQHILVMNVLRPSLLLEYSRSAAA